ncbi:hypothetical protein PP940_gp051 [Rhizobium phage RL2RES]|uniref:Uncharacterized protein n=1 Tax=Rhizobium phage RL2RES TaxID=103371 RepID=A0A6B9J4B4_9CAUD|nr:hypothetical protein PP940_gp051 [Rhizobium phage RL2RES]QGZ14278.1 hypothetical protein RL2RES_051 [Rhizobium phage RL2RES]
MSLYIEKAEHLRSGFSEKIEAFLRSRIKITSEFELEQAHIMEIAGSYWQLVVFVYPEGWPTKLYRVDVLFRDSAIKGPTDFKATLNEVTEL